jgi:hypothetical protein
VRKKTDLFEHGFRITQEERVEEFFSNDKEKIEIWMDIFKQICFQRDFDEKYTFIKNIYKGRYCQVRKTLLILQQEGILFTPISHR